MTKQFNSRVAIGTAQFGMNYGIANKTGKLSDKEIKKILNYALLKGINTIDSAEVYGDCEKRLGKVGVKKFKVITKLPVTNPDKDVSQWVKKSVQASLKRLNLSKVHAVLVHNTTFLLDKKIGKEIYQTLIDLKKKGIIDKIGASVYSLEELNAIKSKFKIDIVLAPFNVFDQRILKKGYIQSLKNEKIQVYTRSTFLQGLLLMSKKNRPKKFDKWKNKFDNWYNKLEKHNKSALQACLNLPLHTSGIYKTVIGVDNFHHFKEIIKKNKKFKFDYKSLALNNDKELINPSKWAKL